MKPIKIALIGASTALFGLGLSPASGQQTGNGTPQQAPSTGPQTTPTPGPDMTANVSDTEVEQFARTAVALQQIRQDATATDADKQAKMAAAIQQSGLTPDRFNQIAEAASSDSALMQRIQLAAGKASGPATP